MDDRPIRVLQVVTILNRGGLESMLMNHYRAIDRGRIQFDFLVHRSCEGEYENEILELGGRIYRMPAITPRNLVVYVKKLDSFFSEHSEYTIIHSHLDALSTFVLRAAKKAKRSCRIAHSHISHMDMNAKAVARIFSKAFLKRYCNEHFACSGIAGDWLFGKQIGKQGRLTLFRNAINTHQFTHSPEVRSRVRTELGLDDRFVIGHVGRFNLQKNHKLLLDIFARILSQEPRAVLLLAGDGSLRPAMEAKAAALGIRENVQFVGVRSDIPDLLQAMDLFLFPSLYEGLPVTVIEAQASGLPCVLSDTISKECDISGILTFLPLAESLDVWCDEVLKLKRGSRLSDAHRRVADAGYDVETNADWLTKFYSSKHHQNQDYNHA